MALGYEPLYASLEDIAQQVSLFEEAVSTNDVTEEDLQIIDNIDKGMREWVAVDASLLKTGFRGKKEEKNLRKSYEILCRLRGARVLHFMNGEYDDGADTGDFRRRGIGYLKDSELEVGALYFDKRLDNSIEQSKQLAARHTLGRAAIGGMASGIGSSVAFKMIEVSSPMIHLTPLQQGGAVGLSAAILLYGGSAVIGATRSAARNIPARAGVFLQNLLNGSWKELLPPKEKYNSETELMEYYAQRHFERAIGDMALVMSGFEITSREVIADMVGSSITELKHGFYESFGMNPEENDRPWHERWRGNEKYLEKTESSLDMPLTLG